jgi:hypothetical protein
MSEDDVEHVIKVRQCVILKQNYYGVEIFGTKLTICYTCSQNV